MKLLDRLDHWVSHTPDSTAIVFENQTISFQSLQQRVNQVAELLVLKFSVNPGERVAYLGINHPDMLYLVFACAKIGAIFAPFNSRLARDEYVFLIENAEPKVCFFDSNFADIVSQLPAQSCPIVTTGELLETYNQAPETSATPHLDVNAPLLLVYTSGTTGRPKGVLLSQAAVMANIENGHDLYHFEPGQNILTTLPLFHVGGLCILLLPSLMNGATTHLHARFDPEKTLRAIQTHKINSTVFVPAQITAMMALDTWNSCDLSSLKYVVVGSSIVPMPLIKAFHDRGIPVSQVYGATETGPTAIALPIEAAVAKEGSAGTTVKLCEISVRTKDGAICKIGENGLIWVKGSNILSGYWRNQNETDLVLKDNWYNTGDIGHVDEDGFYWIVDRAKDVIISGGENIYPAEVESCILQHASVEAIAVVGKPDPHWGETPIAAIELKPDTTLSESELQAFLKDRLARYKQPKSIVLYDKIPRNGMGKIEKAIIRQQVRARSETKRT